MMDRVPNATEIFKCVNQRKQWKRVLAYIQRPKVKLICCIAGYSKYSLPITETTFSIFCVHMHSGASQRLIHNIGKRSFRYVRHVVFVTRTDDVMR